MPLEEDFHRVHGTHGPSLAEAGDGHARRARAGFRRGGRRVVPRGRAGLSPPPQAAAGAPAAAARRAAGEAPAAARRRWCVPDRAPGPRASARFGIADPAIIPGATPPQEHPRPTLARRCSWRRTTPAGRRMLVRPAREVLQASLPSTSSASCCRPRATDQTTARSGVASQPSRGSWHHLVHGPGAAEGCLQRAPVGRQHRLQRRARRASGRASRRRSRTRRRPRRQGRTRGA